MSSMLMLAVVQLHDLLDDRQPESGSFDAAAQYPVERLEHHFAFGRRDARTRILDLQQHHLSE